ncbi:hypothetical protein F5B19DRAFT_402181 [Rostrohypoxylon terebratum]|nr:hypothetical protein F5B19DRAFT_402181 [Rostrohypoxylon terebratum]
MASSEHIGYDASMKNTATSTFETASPGSWEKAYKQHYRNLAVLVSPRWAIQNFFISLGTWFCVKATPVPLHELGYRINFAEMQRMYMRALQIDLINLGVELKFDETSQKNEDWDSTPDTIKKMETMLKTYIQAVRDYDYMTDATQKQYDLFIASSERKQDGVHLDKAFSLARKGVYDLRIEGVDPLPTGPWEDAKDSQMPIPIGGTRNASVQSLVRRALVTRIFLALLGSAFLVGPMWLLALKKDLIFDLGTTTVAVTIFGLLLAFVLDKGDQVFAGTLAYAAVLMVFVGVIIQETPSTSTT